MSVVKPDYASTPRGKIDAARHRAKIKEALRENLPDIISDEAIITRKEGQVIKVPVRGVKSYHFIHGQTGGEGGGLGSGEGKKGKVIGRKAKPGQGRPGKPGDEPGVDYLETEIDLEELIDMMLEDLGLPNLRQKEVRETVIPKGWTYDSIERSGILPRLDKKRSVKEAIKRIELLVARLMAETGLPEQDCRSALAVADGDFEEALRALESGRYCPDEDPECTPRIESSDLRFRTIAEDVEYRSNAVVIAMMDVSGSMDTTKKYFARSFYFWMLSFLRSIYRHVEIRFIAHTTDAKLVDEHEFFHRGESGGTHCYSAYDLATDLMESTYPVSRWNVYPFHFSDGEDWDPDRTVQSVKEMLGKGVSAFGYGEIHGDYSSSVLMEAMEEALDLEKLSSGAFHYYTGTWGDTPLIGAVIRTKEDLYPALRTFLRGENKEAAGKR
jgi:sporulation protein YhbH